MTIRHGEGGYLNMDAVIDGHMDLIYLMQNKGLNVPFEQFSDPVITLDALKQGQVHVFVSAFYCPDQFNGPQTAWPCLKNLLSYAGAYLASLPRIRSKEELSSFYSEKRGPGVLYLLENADALVDIDIQEVVDEGFCAVGLTHVGKNRLADGNLVASPGRLTKAGRELVKTLDRLKVLIDVAHLAETCFWDLIDLVDGPIISSHTGFRRFCDSARNLSADQLYTIIQKGGMVGISVNPEMLSITQEAAVEDVIHQIDWVVQQHGSRVIGIGSDFGGFDGITRNMEHPGKFDQLHKGLLALGYPEKAIGNILGENWRRIYSQQRQFL